MLETGEINVHRFFISHNLAESMIAYQGSLNGIYIFMSNKIAQF